MFYIYRTLTVLLYPIIILVVIFRKFLNKEDRSRYKEKLFSNHFNVSRKINTTLIWFHAASVGELKSIFPIIKILNKNYENLEFLVTTITLSSSNLAKDELKNLSNAHHRFLPVDVHFLIDKFLQEWKPKLIFLVDSEIWPNLIMSAKKNNVHLALINARLTRKTFKRWKLVPKTTQLIFNSINLFLCSNLETKNFLDKLKINNVVYTGNLKLINQFQESFNTRNSDSFFKNKFWLAVSTHRGEEEICLNVHLKLKKKFKNLITVLAPRHITRAKEIEKLCKNHKLVSQILSKNEKILQNIDIIIVNSYGDLLRFYENAQSVFVGKSLIEKKKNDSGQSPIEAAKLGCKIYYGPYVSNFKEIYELLENKNIAKEITGENDLSENLVFDLEKDKKEISKFSKIMNDLSTETLNKNMKEINKFITNAVK